MSGWVLWDHPDVRPLRDLRSEVYTLATARAHEDFTKCAPAGRATQPSTRSVQPSSNGTSRSTAACARRAGPSSAREGGYAVWSAQPART